MKTYAFLRLRYKLILLYVISFFCVGCDDTTEKVLNSHRIYIHFSDNTFTQVKDSLSISNNDTLSLTQLNGYFRITDSQKSYYQQGKLVNGKKEGEWVFYVRLGDSSRLSEKMEYKRGKLNGVHIEYDPIDGTVLSELFFRDDFELGLQKKYHPESKKMVIQYTKDSIGNYIDEYLALNKQGDTLYYVHLGKNGTGYLKLYNRWGVLEREGYLLNGKMEMAKEYIYNYGQEKYIQKRYYINDSLVLTE